MSIEQLFAYINAAFCSLYINTEHKSHGVGYIRITLFYAKQVPVETFLRRSHAYAADGKASRDGITLTQKKREENCVQIQIRSAVWPKGTMIAAATTARRSLR